MARTYFFKAFDSVDDGVVALQAVSYSIADSISGVRTADEALAVMAANTQFHPTGNGVGWIAPRLVADPYGVQYITTGGLEYGWRVLWTSGAAPYSTDTVAGYVFIIGYPGGVAGDESTLAKAAVEQGWIRLEAELVDWPDTWGCLDGAIDKLAPRLLEQVRSHK